MPRPRIMVTRGDALSSRAIEGYGGGWPSHMANLLADGSVWDARSDVINFGGVKYPAGVQHRPAGYLEAENAKWAIFEAPPGSERVYPYWVELLQSQEHKPYDHAGIIAFGVGVFTGKFQDQNYADDKSTAWFCDEYSIWAAGKPGLIPWPLPLKISRQTPGAGLNLFIGARWRLTAAKGWE